MSQGKVAECSGEVHRRRVTIVYKHRGGSPSVSAGRKRVNQSPLPAPFAAE